MKIKKVFLVFLIIFSAAISGQAAINEGYGEDQTSLGQFVDTFSNLDNVSVAVNVVRNATYEAMELNGSAVVFENFTTYTEVDEDGDITLTVPKIDWVSLRRDAETYVWKDFGAGFWGNFLVDFEINMSDLEAGDATSATVSALMTFSNVLGVIDDLTGGDLLIIGLQQSGANDDTYGFYIRQYDGGVSQFLVGSQANFHTTAEGSLYGRFSREGTNVTLSVYSDSARTTLLYSYSSNAAVLDTYRYFMPISNWGRDVDAADHHTGYLQELAFGGGNGFASSGYFTTVDYLSDPLANGSALVYLTNTTMPANTAITLEFSDDNSTWIFNDWQPIFGGFESVDLRDLNYSAGLYTRFNLSTSNPAVTPRVYQSRLITTIGAGGTTINQTINLVNGTWEYHNVSSILTTVGIHDSGDVNSTLDIDGDSYNCSEVVGAPGYRISFTFADVNSSAGCLWIVSYIYYDGNQAHDIHIEVYNQTSLAWVEIGVIDDDVAFEWHNASIYELRIPSDFIDDSGSVFGRFDHVAAGNINHDIYIEYLKLHAFIPTGLAEAGAAAETFQLFWIAIAISLMIIGILLARMWPHEGDP